MIGERQAPLQIGNSATSGQSLEVRVVRVGGGQNEPRTVQSAINVKVAGFWDTACSSWVQTLLLRCAGQERNCSGENWEVRTWDERETCNRMGACGPENGLPEREVKGKM